MSKKKPAIANGYLLIDKPVGLTSHDVVAQVRTALKERRVGHSGTLDPDATGVLLLGVGHGTRLLRLTSTFAKTYVSELVLGTTTSTLDASGYVTGTFDMSHVTLEDIRTAAKQFIGDIEQLPPMVSAVKVDGKRLYTLARDGSEVERTARPVHVHSIDIDETDREGIFILSVTCSSGTYVRTIADDIGSALGGGAHLQELRRTAIGHFSADDAVLLENVSLSDVRPAKELVSHLEAIPADQERIDAISNGTVFEVEDFALEGEGPWAFYDEDQSLLAIYELWRHKKMKPGIVLVGSPSYNVGANG